MHGEQAGRDVGFCLVTMPSVSHGAWLVRGCIVGAAALVQRGRVGVDVGQQNARLPRCTEPSTDPVGRNNSHALLRGSHRQ